MGRLVVNVHVVIALHVVITLKANVHAETVLMGNVLRAATDRPTARHGLIATEKEMLSVARAKVAIVNDAIANHPNRFIAGKFIVLT